MENKNQIESNKFYGFYEIPGFSRYAISLNGEVLNKSTNLLLRGSRNPAGYYNYRLTGDDGNVLTWGRHRLLGFVFKHPKKDIRNLVINHKNGIKGCDEINNLEWVTQQGNIEHAGEMGLTSKCCPISVRDVDTGEILKFASIMECSKFIGISKDAINYRLKCGQNRIFPERKQYRATHRNDPWYVSENIECDLMQNSTSKSVSLKYVFTGIIFKFDKLGDLAMHLNVSPSTITQWLSLKNQPVLPGYIQIKWAHDSTPWRKVSDPHLELNENRITKTIQIVNTITGEIKIYPSASKCAQDRGLSPTALNYRLKSNGATIFSDNYRYGYYPF